MPVRTEVIYEDLGLGSLPQDAERLLRAVVQKSARDVEAQMKHLITERRFLDTGATKNSVRVDMGTHALERDIGPTTHYAIYGEMGYHQTHAWGRKLKTPIYHPGLHFARDALKSVRAGFVGAIRAAMAQLGGRQVRTLKDYL